MVSSKNSENGNGSSWSRLGNIIVTTAIMAVFALIGTLYMRIVDVDKQGVKNTQAIAGMVDNYGRIASELGKLRDSIDQLKDKMPRENPPQWVVEKLNGHDRRIGSLESDVRQLEKLNP